VTGFWLLAFCPAKFMAHPSAAQRVTNKSSIFSPMNNTIIIGRGGASLFQAKIFTYLPNNLKLDGIGC
jgi:hypothetical protein